MPQKSPSSPGQPFDWSRVPFHTSPSGTERTDSTASLSGPAFFYVTPTNSFKLYRLEILR